MRNPDRSALLRALRRARVARICAAGFTRTPLERARHIARARMWLSFAHGLTTTRSTTT